MGNIGHLLSIGPESEVADHVVSLFLYAIHDHAPLAVATGRVCHSAPVGIENDAAYHVVERPFNSTEADEVLCSLSLHVSDALSVRAEDGCPALPQRMFGGDEPQLCIFSEIRRFPAAQRKECG